MTTAIESRTPYNANHTKNVSKLCKEFIEYLIENNLYNLTENDKEQLVMAAMLHDVGKMIVPLSVMNKSTRLDGKLELMKSRWNIIRLDLENKYLKKELRYEDYNSKLEELNSACEFIEMIDTVPFLDTNKLDRIHQIIKLEYETVYGKLKIVEKTEEQDVLIVKGTLTFDERKEIEKHAVYTEEILKEIEFGKKYNNVRYIAGAHHEYIDGTGYPNKMENKELSILVRILTIMDVYESLTSTDRPYKKPMPKERAYKILCEMVNEGKLDSDLVECLKGFINIEV
jgi:HD-GYP domain-containing protein (c-di-GMP phosphodiesterase class II)